MKRILVVSNNKRHIIDAETFFSKNSDYQVDYAKNGKEASTMIFNAITLKNVRGYDGIIVDIFVPWEHTIPVKSPIGGLLVVTKHRGTHCLLCASTDDRADEYEWMENILNDAIGSIAIADWGRGWTEVERAFKKVMNPPTSWG